SHPFHLISYSTLSSLPMAKQLLLILPLFACLLILATALKPCQKLALCALEKCIEPKENGTKTPVEEEIIDNLIGRFNFGCMYGPSCYDYCMGCDTCKYGMEQIKNIVVHNKSDGQCPSLEKCAKDCFSDQVRSRSPWDCFRTQCAPECFDRRKCNTCYDTMKSIFSAFCYREGYNYKFKTKCRELFDKTSTDLVFRRRRLL
ncbi:hypothetical protein PMAYCL1PPCAC_02862, partial [Pristionchus mayeri]